jgi:SHS2 domain-containing protein
MAYNFLEHTADVKFQAEAENLEEAFKESASALKETICGDINILELVKKELKIEGTDLQNLLYKFLEEFIVLLDSEDFMFAKVETIKIDKEKFTLEATITGDKGEHYSFTNDVKAVTYNEMEIKENPEKNSWKITVVLDV